jgi:hypothetical protein
MKALHLATGALALGLAACNYSSNYNNAAAYNEQGAAYNATGNYGAANYSANEMNYSANTMGNESMNATGMNAVNNTANATTNY